MNARVVEILRRFPLHLEAFAPDKQFGVVASALAHDLDLLSAELAAVRRARRLGHADTLLDLSLIGGLCAIVPAEFRALDLRLERLKTLLGELAGAVDAGDAPARAEAAERVLACFELGAPPPRLALFAPEPATESDLELAAGERVLALAGEFVRHASRLELTRSRIRTISAVHARGNGTISALLHGAANALDLEIDEPANRELLEKLSESGAAGLDFAVSDALLHSADRFLHAALVRDRFDLSKSAHPVARASGAGEIVGLVENPLRRQQEALGGKPHAALFSVARRGFGARALRVTIQGVEDRTFGPVFVNRDEGRGFGFTGNVPNGSALTYHEQGQADLDGSDVTESCFSFEGACFAQVDAPSPRDFVFDGPGLPAALSPRRARFVTVKPAAGLDFEAIFPHLLPALDPLHVALGTTRFAFFVQVAHLSAREIGEAGPRLRPVTPRFLIGFADRSTFASTSSPPHAGQITLSWLEHEAFAVRVLIPPRFRQFDRDADTVADAVRVALERFRPAGVRLEVAYPDERWVLGEGELVGGSAQNPLLRLLGGTELWPSSPTDGA